MTISTGLISTVAGSGTAGFSGDGGAATSAALYNPLGVGVDSTGSYYSISSTFFWLTSSCCCYR